MNKINELLNSENIPLSEENVSGSKIKYFVLGEFADLDMTYGVCDKGWVVKLKLKKVIIIDWQNENLSPLLKLLESDPSNLYNKIVDNINSSHYEYKLSFFDLFPTVELFMFIINMKSVYWLNKIYDLIKLIGVPLEMKMTFDTLQNKKWIDQNLRHKFQKLKDID